MSLIGKTHYRHAADQVGYVPCMRHPRENTFPPGNPFSTLNQRNRIQLQPYTPIYILPVPDRKGIKEAR